MRKITEGRHDIIFPMFEFEFPGNIKDLEEMERELCEHMGFGNKHSIVDKDYLEWCEYFDLYNGEELSHEHEEEMCKKWQGRVCMIKNFPNYTSPFWNMKTEWRWYSSQDRCYYFRTGNNWFSGTCR